MSSFRFEGDNNRAAWRDYYENCEWNFHLYAGSGNQQSQNPPTLEQLLELLPAARRDAFRKNVRKYVNRPTLVILAGLCLALAALFIVASGLPEYVDGPWVLSIPMGLLVISSLYWNRSLPEIRAIHESSVNADTLLADIEMEIARRREAARHSKMTR
jgi:hypothetical protein